MIKGLFPFLGAALLFGCHVRTLERENTPISKKIKSGVQTAMGGESEPFNPNCSNKPDMPVKTSQSAIA